MYIVANVKYKRSVIVQYKFNFLEVVYSRNICDNWAYEHCITCPLFYI